MKTPALYIPNKSITVIIKGNPKTVLAENKLFKDVIQAWRKGNESLFLALIDKATAVKNILKDENCVVVKNGKVFYNDEELNGVIVERILSHKKEGAPIKPLLNFLEKLMMNTDKVVREQLYKFLEHNGFPIDENGDVYAYKKVDEKNMDYYSRSVKYDVGTVVMMEKNKVDNNPNRTCSHGLHVGAFNYVNNVWHAGQGKIMLVKFNPEDAVSVPTDHDGEKLRVWKLSVVQELNNAQPIKKAFLGKKGINLPKRGPNGQFVRNR